MKTVSAKELHDELTRILTAVQVSRESFTVTRSGKVVGILSPMPDQGYVKIHHEIGGKVFEGQSK